MADVEALIGQAKGLISRGKVSAQTYPGIDG